LKKLFKFIFLIVILGLIGIGGFVYNSYSDLKEVTNVDLAELSSGNLKAEDLDLPIETKHWVETKTEELDSVVETIGKGVVTDIEDKLQDVISQNPYLKSAFYVDLKGNLISTAESQETTDVSQEDYFKQVLATNELYISKPFFKDGALSVLIAYPVKDKDAHNIGVVGGTIPVTNLAKIKEQIGLKS